MLKLTQLPDRIPVKLTITLQPDLKKALDDYAALYARTYGAEEPVAELVPFMLENFLKADAGFRKGRKELEDEPMSHGSALFQDQNDQCARRLFVNSA